jgi:putative ABC transport system permease protein
VNDLRLLLRAFGWRRGGSLVLLVVASLTIAAAAIGPLYAAAAAESVLQDRLREATADQTTIAFSEPSDVSYPGSIDVVSADQDGRGTIPGYGPPVNEINVATGITGTAKNAVPAVTQAVWRDGACDHLDIVQGVCATQVGEIMLSARSAAFFHWAIGSSVVLDRIRQYDTSVPGNAIATKPVVLKVVGTYRPRSTLDPFWAGRIYFAFNPATGPGDGPSTVDDAFVARDLFQTLIRPTNGAIAADLVLTDPDAIRVADVPTVRAAVEAYLGPESTNPQPTTGMLALLDRFEAERTQTAIAAGVVSAQLALLALLLLYLVITDTSEARGNEVALAKLRGLRPRSVVAVAIREPVVLLMVAVPLGLALAYAGALLLARLLFVAGVPVAVTPATWVAVGIAFLGGLVAAVIATRRIFTRPVLEQWSSTRSQEGGRRGWVLDVVLVLIAVGGFVVLRQSVSTGDTSSAFTALGWAAPGLMVIALALLLARLAGPLLSRLVPVTRASNRLGIFLAVRQVARRPAGLRLAALLAVTIGLATFAVDAQAAAVQSRHVRAQTDIGATASVAVQDEAVADLVHQVDAADPDGRWSMVSGQWIPDGGTLAGRMLAVDSGRMAAVGYWAPEFGAGTVQDAVDAIAPPLPPPLRLTSSHLRVRITSGPVAGTGPTVLLAYRDANGRVTTAVTTPLTTGAHDYSAAVPCTGGCTFFGVAVDRAQAPSSLALDMLITAVAQGDGTTWTPVPAALSAPADWRVGGYTGDPVGELAASSAGLHYTGTAPATVSPFVQYADSPVPLPLVTTPLSAGPPSPDGPNVIDGIGRHVPIQSAATATILPAVGDSGVLVDLTALRRSVQQLDDEAHFSVWLGPQAPADAIEQLRKAGVPVDSVTTAAEREDQLGREGPALALRLLLVCALAGAVLAASAVAISVAVTGRRRSYELAALRAVHVKRSALVAACVLEQGLLLGIGLVVGVPTGLVVARLALPTLPQTSTPTTLPLTVDVQTLAVGVFVLAATALLIATAVAAGFTLVRQAVPDRLREAAQ